MTTKVISDDIYIYTFFDQEERKVYTGLATTLEEFESISKMEDLKILTFFNISGKDMVIGDAHIINEFEVAIKNVK